MRRFLMVLPLVMALAACDNKPSGGGTTGGGSTGGGGKTEAPAAKAYKYDAFESWNAFKEGSSIAIEMDTAGTKMKQTKAIDKKTADEITLKTEMIMKVGDNEMKTPGTEPVKKAGAAMDGNCALCSKPYKDHKDEGKWSEEKVKIGDKEVTAKVYESPAKNCKGDDVPKTKMWYSSEVPGHMVKMETAQMKLTVTAFDAK